MSQPRAETGLSELEYLEIERAAGFKSEFFDGEMFAMAGGTFEHRVIATNLARELRLKRSCVACNSELRIKVEATGLYTYPDLSIICGPVQFAEGTRDTAVNPTVLVEVLSDSTEAYDRGKKFEHYRQIPTLRAYLLVSQREPRIDQFVRQENGPWILSEAAGLNATLAVPSVDAALSLREVYAHIEFGAEPLRPVPADPRPPA